MSKTYRPYNPHQTFLLPPSPHDWLPEGHLAYFILDLVSELDLRPIYDYYERELRGYPPHHPQMMVALLLYAYAVGVRSSRKIERHTYEDVAFRVIAGGSHPDHTRISEFRRIHLAALEKLFVQVLRLCANAGLIKLGHVAIDGTKMKANASKHKAMSYKRMKEEEAKLRAKVQALLEAAERIDREEDALYGEGVLGDELPEELRRSEQRLKKIREAKAALEAEARASRERSEEGESEEGDDDADGDAGGASQLPRHKVQAYADGTPKPHAQRNFTDPDSRIQKSGKDYIQGYNAQVAVDGKAQVIVACAVTNHPNDVEHFAPMLDRIEAECGRLPTKVTADAGYFSEQNVRLAEERGLDAYIAVGRERSSERSVSPRGRPRLDLTPRARMARKLSTKRGTETYRKRKAIVEAPIGHIKEILGVRSFSLRGLSKVRGEWSLICMVHNILKLYRATC